VRIQNAEIIESNGRLIPSQKL